VKNAIRESQGALLMLCGSASANRSDRRINITSTVERDMALPRTTYHKCCAKQSPIPPVNVALKTVTQRRDRFEA
jgi:hypothetical protein